MRNGRFAIAVHTLALLGQSDEWSSSAFIASSVNTNAAFLRRVLSQLVRTGLVEAREGREGGYRLARPAGKITLADVYRSTVTDGILAESPAVPNPRCPVGAGMKTAFKEAAAAAEQFLMLSLSQKTVAEIAERAVNAGKCTRGEEACLVS